MGPVLKALHDEIFSGPLESVATVFGVVNIVLLVRRNIWNYLAGMVSVGIFCWVFFGARLYSDALLQVFFFVVQILGWVAWSRHQEPEGDVVVETSNRRYLAGALLATGVTAVLLGYVMRRYFHAAFPYWDATVAGASVTAQIMLTYRRIENWMWWIGSNVISIVIYSRKGLYMTSLLYGFYLTMSVLGYLSWKRSLRAQGPR